jgi:hypothetical protein
MISLQWMMNDLLLKRDAFKAVFFGISTPNYLDKVLMSPISKDAPLPMLYNINPAEVLHLLNVALQN